MIVYFVHPIMKVGLSGDHPSRIVRTWIGLINRGFTLQLQMVQRAYFGDVLRPFRGAKHFFALHCKLYHVSPFSRATRPSCQVAQGTSTKGNRLTDPLRKSRCNI